MKKSISIWSFSSELDLDGKFALAKQAGFEGFELDLSEKGPVTASSSEAELKQVRKQADRHGLKLSGLASGLYWTYSLTSNDSKIREKASVILKRQIECAAGLGVDAILVVPGCVHASFIPNCEVIPYEICLDRAREQIGAAVSSAEKHKVKICLENVWNQFLTSPTEFREFIGGFGSSQVAAYFDVGNTLALGFPEQWIEILAGRIGRVHFKDFRRAVGTIHGFVDLLSGDVDWKAVMTAFGKIGYDGWCTAEMIPPYRYAPQVLIHNTSRAMEAIFALGGSR